LLIARRIIIRARIYAKAISEEGINLIRLGGPIFEKADDPYSWVAALRRLNYSTTFCPAGPATPPDVIAAYRRAAERADIVIAEVGAWSNPISPNPEERSKAIANCQRCLALAEEIGARCCVNIAGSRGEKWDGPDPANDSRETFDLIVETVRQIIDAVKPSHTTYALETMPWVPPDSPDNYLALLKAVDRKGFGVHLDPVNMINCPTRAYHTGDFLRECFAKLGPHIRGCHAKDIRFASRLTVHLDECAPGEGCLDYPVFLRELAAMNRDVPVLLEHMKTAEEYHQAASYVRGVASKIGVEIR
jgi:sugar phosphate isomerase/epimerase